MKDNLQFRVSAELKNILGRDLITSPDIAILELVKNSYDAHATKVEITFDKDYLCIADNGKGMTKDDLINKWLFVAYSAKSDGTEDKSYRSKFKRHYAGAKGIGRMSCDRLARNLILTTRSEESKTEVLHVDWSVFEKNRKTEFDTVDIPHETLETIPQFPLGYTTGTILEFTGLHTPWSRDDIKRLRKSLEKMINPFSGTDDNFQIEIIAPEMIKDDSQIESKHDKVNGIIENSIADVLKLKTTQIESHIQGGTIHTVLKDRGILMYEIEEPNIDFSQLDSASISLFFLNRAAKYSFTSMMGVQPVSYGNVLLFRNGFRILPYGEWNDDSWGFSSSQHQPSPNSSSSLNEGATTKRPRIVSTPNPFTLSTKARISERYVAGVLWGEGFLRKEYFVSQGHALDARKQLEGDKDSDSAGHLYSNIGSKVDFLQLIKSLVNDKSIKVLKYNEDLANIVADPTDTEVIQAQMIDDVRKLAEKTNDPYLQDRIAEFEKHMDELRRQKEEAEREAEAERKAKEAAELKAAEERKAKEQAERKVKEEEEKRKKVEVELKQRTKQNLFLQSVGSLDTDRILKYHHDIRIHAATIHNTIGQILRKANQGSLSTEDTIKMIERISRANDKITSIAQFATKANYNINADTIHADIVNYIDEYINNVLPEFYGDLKMHCINNTCSKILDFSPLEASIFIDNLVSNSVKANSKHFDVAFENDNDAVCMTISDDGIGLSLDIVDPNSILEKGYTTTNGSGLGLYNVASFVKTVMHGSVSVENKQGKQGFKLKIKF